MGPELWRIDGARNVVERPSASRRRPGPRSGASDGESLYVLRPDRILERRDASDGRRVASVRSALSGAIVAARDGKVLLSRDDGVAAIDAGDGRTLWQRRLRSARLNQVLISGGSVWVQGTPIGSAGDRLWRLDASTGRVLGVVNLPEYGASGMAVVGDRVWIAAPESAAACRSWAARA